MNRPLLIDPHAFGAMTADMGTREFGILMRLALHYWEVGELPNGAPAMAKIADVKPAAMEDLRPRLMPFFAPGGLFPILREASNAKYERRARAGRIGGKNRWAAAHTSMQS